MSEQRVAVTELKRHVDDRGTLEEVLRCDDREFVKFGQVYVVQSRAVGTVRAFHRHEKLWDHFCIVAGAALFQFVDDMVSAGSVPAGTPYRITADAAKPVVLRVPPGVWHGWMSLEPNTILLSIASEPYNPEEPDEERLPPVSFGARWEVEAK